MHPCTTTHLVLRMHIGALLEQQRRGGRVTLIGRSDVKGRETLLHMTEERRAGEHTNM